MTLDEIEEKVSDAIFAFGPRVKRLRKEAGFTQDRLSVRSGLSAAAICKIEKGVNTPTFENLVRLTIALECDINELILL